MAGGGVLIYFKYPHLIPFFSPKVSVSEDERIISEINEKYNLAKEKVKEKYSNTEPKLVMVQVLKNASEDVAFSLGEFENLKIGSEGHYLYVLNVSKTKNVLVFVKIDSNEITKIVEVVPRSIGNEVFLAELGISWSKAWSILNKHGGETFKNKNENIRQFGPILVNHEQYGLVWYLGYIQETKSTYKTLIFYIDARSGKIKAQEK